MSNDQSHNAKFSLVFNGRDVKDGKMNVRDLAPALLATAGIIEESNFIFNGSSAQVTTSLEANIKESSLEILIDVAQFVAEQMSIQDISYVQFILDKIGWLSDQLEYTGEMLTLIRVVRKIAGRIYKLFKKNEGDKYVLQIEENGKIVEEIDIDSDLYKLLSNHGVREKLLELLKPLKKKGIKSITWKYKGRQIESVKKEEYRYFLLPEASAEDEDRDFIESTFTIRALGFDRRSVWRLWDSKTGMSYKVRIKDDIFWDQVEKNTPFTKGDRLEARIEKKIKIVQGKAREQWMLTNIMRHFQAHQQNELIN